MPTNPAFVRCRYRFALSPCLWQAVQCGEAFKTEVSLSLLWVVAAGLTNAPVG